MNKKHSIKVYNFRTIIEPDRPFGYHGFVPLLRGVHTQGKTIEETKKNLKEAIICHLQGLIINKKALGSHAQFKHFDGRRITVPIHSGKDLGKNTLKSIIDDLDVSIEEFIKLLKS